MKTVALRRVLAPFAYVALLASAPAISQVGPIQPVLVTGGKVEISHDRPELGDDYSVPVEAFIAADGSVSRVAVSQSSGNAQADEIAAAHVRGRSFLPGLDERGEAVASTVKLQVSMFKRGTRKVVRVVTKPPAVAEENERVRKMMCADFLFEVDRMRQQAGIKDTSDEVMPYLSARMYMQQKRIASEVEEKFWDAWPGALKKVIAACEKDQLKFYYSEVLVPALDGSLPSVVTASASAQ
jgi:hypothetical protein